MRLLLLIPMLAACAPAPTPPEPRSPCREQAFEGSAFIVCDPGKGELRLFAAGTTETPVRRFAELDLDPQRVAFAMNAGMFDEQGRPIGLTIVGGRQVRAINLKDGPGNFHLKPNGVFSVAMTGTATIAQSGPMTATQRAPSVQLATQSGPLLVIGGKLHPKLAPDGDSRYVRNGVGVARGKALFVISVDAVSLGKFARFFRDALKTPDALYFDGSVSSLWDPTGGRMDSFTGLGPIIVAFKPAESAPGREARATP